MQFVVAIDESAAEERERGQALGRSSNSGSWGDADSVGVELRDLGLQWAAGRPGRRGGGAPPAPSTSADRASGQAVLLLVVVNQSRVHLATSRTASSWARGTPPPPSTLPA